MVLEHSVHTILVTRSDPGLPCPDLAADTGGGPVTVTHRDDEVSYHFKAKNFILEFGTSVRKAVKVIYSDSFLNEAERAEESAALVEAVLARLQLPGPVLVLDNSPGPGAGAAFCALVAVAQQTEAEQHCDVYVYPHYLSISIAYIAYSIYVYNFEEMKNTLIHNCIGCHCSCSILAVSILLTIYSV